MTLLHENPTDERALLLALERELDDDGALPPEPGGPFAAWRGPLTLAAVILTGAALGLVAVLLVCAVKVFVG